MPKVSYTMRAKYLPITSKHVLCINLLIKQPVTNLRYIVKKNKEIFTTEYSFIVDDVSYDNIVLYLLPPVRMYIEEGTLFVEAVEKSSMVVIDVKHINNLKHSEIYPFPGTLMQFKLIHDEITVEDYLFTFTGLNMNSVLNNFKDMFEV